ncbi:carbohydrate ABC transporter permease [Thorsellia anophelis]|uniref:sn-glycerol 3-phosphate transport system permease protein n=1 Tax=Thorsellia anophelis DSM 18579 TaxID=1123402 RepID=A0A1H9YNR9_9GAMM|nr:carbohydrate ABC transporter permease [Thorsellia anophelis]SES70718.1 sn-glycerol 3-phosphate transport system permease protein [Thorsellia anophelis DSM 18579]
MNIKKLITMVLVSIVALIWVIPFLWMLSASLQLSHPYLAVLIPNQFPNLDKFVDALSYASWGNLYLNTIIFTLGTLAGQLVTITLAGFVFAYFKFPGKNLIFYAFLVQLLIIPTVLIVPNMSTLQSVGLLDTLFGIMLPYFASAFGTFLMRQAFRSIPKEYIEAALMDGASLMQILRIILVPMVKPSLTAFSIVSISAHWNEYLWPLMVINSPSNQVLTVGFASFSKSAEAGADWGLVAAGALMIAAPLIIIFLLFQKTFIQSFGFSELK